MNNPNIHYRFKPVLKPVVAALALAASGWAVAGTVPTSRAGIEYVPPQVTFDHVVAGTKATASSVVDDLKDAGHAIVAKTKSVTSTVADDLKDAGHSMEAARTGFEMPAVSRAGVEYVPPKLSGRQAGMDGAVADNGFALPETNRAGVSYDPPQVSPDTIADAVEDSAGNVWNAVTSEAESIWQGSDPALDSAPVSRMGVEYVPPRYQSLDDMTSSVELMNSRS